MWQEGIGSLLLLAAAQQTGLLPLLGTTIQRVAAHSRGLPLNPVVIGRLVLTLLFLPVAGLARTWDLRTYTGTLLALVTGRGRAYSYAYVEQFLSRLAHAGADERLTDAMAQWTWTLWHNQRAKPEQEQEERQAVFYVDRHRKAVYSDVLVPRGPIGKLGGKILGCRELVVLHDQEGHPLLASTHRGDQHLTVGTPELLRRYEQASELVHLDSLVVDREGMAVEFLSQLHAEGRRVVTLLKVNQYEDEGSFTEVGEWLPWRLDREGKMVCEVAAARFELPRPAMARATRPFWTCASCPIAISRSMQLRSQYGSEPGCGAGRPAPRRSNTKEGKDDVGSHCHSKVERDPERHITRGSRSFHGQDPSACC